MKVEAPVVDRFGSRVWPAIAFRDRWISGLGVSSRRWKRKHSHLIVADVDGGKVRTLCGLVLRRGLFYESSWRRCANCEYIRGW